MSSSSSNPSKRMMEIKNPLASNYIINTGKPLQKRISSENKRVLSSNKNANNNMLNNNELSKNYLVTKYLRNYSSSINKNRQINKSKKKLSESPYNMHLINTKLKSGNIKANPSLSSNKSKASYNPMKKNPKINFGSPQQCFCKSLGKDNIIYKKSFKRNDANNNISNNSNNSNINNNSNSSNNNIINNLKIKNRSLLSNNSNNLNTNNNNLLSPSISSNSINNKNNIKVNTCAIYTTGNTSKENEYKQLNIINNNVKNFNINKCAKTKSAEQNLRNPKKNNKNLKNENNINRNENKLMNKGDSEYLTQQVIKNENENKKNFYNKESPSKSSTKNVQDSSINSFNVNNGIGANNINIIKNNSNFYNNLINGDDIDIEELHFSMVGIMQNFKLNESNF